MPSSNRKITGLVSYSGKFPFEPDVVSDVVFSVLRLNQMLYALYLSYHSSTEAVLAVCMSFVRLGHRNR